MCVCVLGESSQSSSSFSPALKPLLVGGSAIWPGAPGEGITAPKKLGVAMLYCPSLLPADGSGCAAANAKVAVACGEVEGTVKWQQGRRGRHGNIRAAMVHKEDC